MCQSGTKQEDRQDSRAEGQRRAAPVAANEQRASVSSRPIVTGQDAQGQTASHLGLCLAPFAQILPIGPSLPCGARAQGHARVRAVLSRDGRGKAGAGGAAGEGAFEAHRTPPHRAPLSIFKKIGCADGASCAPPRRIYRKCRRSTGQNGARGGKERGHCDSSAIIFFVATTTVATASSSVACSKRAASTRPFGLLLPLALFR